MIYVLCTPSSYVLLIIVKQVRYYLHDIYSLHCMRTSHYVPHGVVDSVTFPVKVSEQAYLEVLTIYIRDVHSWGNVSERRSEN
jgi:hypothetical protein